MELLNTDGEELTVKFSAGDFTKLYSIVGATANLIELEKEGVTSPQEEGFIDTIMVERNSIEQFSDKFAEIFAEAFKNPSGNEELG